MDISNKEEGKGGKKLWLVLGFIAFVLIIVFYWYAWRPTQIKKQCFKNEGWTADYYECLMNNGVDFLLQ